MINFIFTIIIFFATFPPAGKILTDIVAPGATVEKLSGGFTFTEGPASDKEGNVFFTDQPNNRILKWSTGDVLSTWMKPSGRSNGLCFDGEGNLWACADEKNELWKISPEQDIKVVIGKYDKKYLNGPNDLWISPSGDIYFSDPYYKRPWWDHETMPQDCQCVYYLSAGSLTPVRIVTDMVQPNGIIGTPDGKTLYITDIGDKKTYSYIIGHDGKLSGKKLFCEMGSDGMTIDEEGNLYLTGKGVTVFDRAGNQIRHIDIDEPWTANVCFGGKNMQSLFITASKGLYRVKMNVRGSGSQ